MNAVFIIVLALLSQWARVADQGIDFAHVRFLLRPFCDAQDKTSRRFQLFLEPNGDICSFRSHGIPIDKKDLSASNEDKTRSIYLLVRAPKKTGIPVLVKACFQLKVLLPRNCQTTVIIVLDAFDEASVGRIPNDESLLKK